jgi:quercetin dioxygenase-like cupin family protein
MTETAPIRTAPIYVVAGGNHVAIVVDAAETGGAHDLVEILAAPGGGPPPHQHEFVEWFHVLDGELTLTGERDGAIVPVAVLHAGGTARVDPWVWHGTVNASDADVRFVVTAAPGEMTTYFARAGVRVAAMDAAPDHDPPGPAVLRELAAEYGIRFWTREHDHAR